MGVMALVKSRWQDRVHFARLRDWVVSMYDVALRLAPGAPLPLRNRAWALRVKQQPQPVIVRLGRSDGFVLKEIFLTGVYQPVLAELREPVKQIVDLGANVGFSVRLWMERFPQARILAVEPDAENFAVLQRNVLLAGAAPATRVRCVRACIADRPGKVYLDRSAEDCAIHVTERAVGEPVDGLPLPQLLSEAGFDAQIDLLKMDIEGSERQVLADCAAWIANVRWLMIELHGEYREADLLQALKANGGRFELRWKDSTAGNPLLLLKQGV